MVNTSLQLFEHPQYKFHKTYASLKTKLTYTNLAISSHHEIDFIHCQVTTMLKSIYDICEVNGYDEPNFVDYLIYLLHQGCFLLQRLNRMEEANALFFQIKYLYEPKESNLNFTSKNISQCIHLADTLNKINCTDAFSPTVVKNCFSAVVEYYFDRDIAKSIEYAKLLLRVTRNWQAHYILGVCYLGSKNEFLALKSIEKMLQVAPTNYQNILSDSVIDIGMYLDITLRYIELCIHYPSKNYINSVNTQIEHFTQLAQKLMAHPQTTIGAEEAYRVNITLSKFLFIKKEFTELIKLFTGITEAVDYLFDDDKFTPSYTNTLEDNFLVLAFIAVSHYLNDQKDLANDYYKFLNSQLHKRFIDQPLSQKDNTDKQAILITYVLELILNDTKELLDSEWLPKLCRDNNYRLDDLKPSYLKTKLQLLLYFPLADSLGNKLFALLREEIFNCRDFPEIQFLRDEVKGKYPSSLMLNMYNNFWSNGQSTTTTDVDIVTNSYLL